MKSKVVLLEHPVWSSRVKARSNPSWLYFTMVMFLRCYLVEGIARICLDWFFKVKI